MKKIPHTTARTQAICQEYLVWLTIQGRQLLRTRCAVCCMACAAMPAILLAFPFLPEGFRFAAFADVLAVFLSGALRPALKRAAALRAVLRSIISESLKSRTAAGPTVSKIYDCAQRHIPLIRECAWLMFTAIPTVPIYPAKKMISSIQLCARKEVIEELARYSGPTAVHNAIHAHTRETAVQRRISQKRCSLGCCV